MHSRSDDPLPPLPRPAFGRVGVRMLGAVMLFHAEGPFDSEMIAAVRRAVQTTLKRLPEMRRFVQLIEFHGSAAMAASALEELRSFVDEQVGRGVLPYSTILFAPPEMPGRASLDGVVAIMSPTRPVYIVASAEQAWAQANADLRAAGLPAQEPHRGSAAPRECGS